MAHVLLFFSRYEANGVRMVHAGLAFGRYLHGPDARVGAGCRDTS